MSKDKESYFLIVPDLNERKDVILVSFLCAYYTKSETCCPSCSLSWHSLSSVCKLECSRGRVTDLFRRSGVGFFPLTLFWTTGLLDSCVSGLKVLKPFRSAIPRPTTSPPRSVFWTRDLWTSCQDTLEIELWIDTFLHSHFTCLWFISVQF